MKREVFFVADDFGLSPAVNAAILAGHRAGALHGASLMVGQPGTAAAVALARGCPALQTGWHLHLCHSQPLTVAAWPWGRSPARAGWAIGLSAAARRLVRAEIAAQWDAFGATGLPCAFVNVHHHLHAHPVVYRELVRVLPRGRPLWLRLGAPRLFPASPRQWWLTQSEWFCWRPRRRRCPFASSDTLWGVDRLYRMEAAEIAAAVAQLPPGRHEFLFHPRAETGDRDLACLVELRRRGVTGSVG
jgi:hypothetical protein